MGLVGKEVGGLPCSPESSPSGLASQKPVSLLFSLQTEKELEEETAEKDHRAWGAAHTPSP